MVIFNISNSDNILVQIQDCIKSINDIDLEIENTKQCIVDLSGLTWLLPCSILILGNKINELFQNNIKISIVPPSDDKVRQHLEKLGFPLGGALKGDTYYPITYFTAYDDINKTVNDLIDHLKKQIHSNFGSGVTYLLSELSDNIDIHSNFSHAAVMAQYFPKKNKLDLSIIDNGISVPHNFEKHGIKFSDDCDAIKKAIEGISTKEESGRGFGLRTSKNLVLEGLNGEMYILSRKGALILNPKNKEKSQEIMKKPLKGTLIYMRFSAPKKGLNIIEYVE